jgi:glycosyltransferase involved in cell wall biosynthesis
VPPKDPEALARAIEQVLGDRELATYLAMNGARRARDFTWDIQTQKYARLFGALI